MNIGELQETTRLAHKDLRLVVIEKCTESQMMFLTILHKPSDKKKQASIVPWHNKEQIIQIIKNEFEELITETCEDKPKRRPRNTYDLETFVTMETEDGPKVTLTRRPNLLVIEVDKKIVFRMNNREAENFRKIVNTLVDVQMGVGQIK